MPGIFFKYDISPILITVGEQSYTLAQFVVRLCGIVGGVFVTAGLVYDGEGAWLYGEMGWWAGDGGNSMGHIFA